MVTTYSPYIFGRLITREYYSEFIANHNNKFVKEHNLIVKAIPER